MKLFVLFVVAFGSAASTLADERPEPAPTVQPFIHPGLLHSRVELDFIKQKIIAGEQPWKSAWEQLQSSKAASLTYSPKPFADVVRGVRNNPNIGSSDMSNDAAAAYAHALQWSLTERKAHATKAIEILNAWATTLESVSGHDAKLLIGILDDRAMFDRAVDYYLHGRGNGAIEKYFNEFGECQESGRDQAHVQMGIGFLACACEMAWKQGVDLYGAAMN